MKVILDQLSLSEFFEAGGTLVDVSGAITSWREYTRGETYTLNIKDAYIGKNHYSWNGSVFTYTGTLGVMPAKDPFGIPSVCFSKITEDDRRWERYQEQRLSRGFDDSEIWDLAGTISGFILPRLTEFIKVSEYDYPACFDSGASWVTTLEKIKYAFENYREPGPEVQEGFREFGRWFAWLGF